MAIRKISELPDVNPLDENIRNILSGSFMELSYPESDSEI